jgi:hypothetical protein
MRPELREQIVLKAQRIDVAPSMLEPDACADVDEGEVVVKNLGAQWLDDDEPAGQGKNDEQEPGERSGAQIAPLTV